MEIRAIMPSFMKLETHSQQQSTQPTTQSLLSRVTQHASAATRAACLVMLAGCSNPTGALETVFSIASLYEGKKTPQSTYQEPEKSAAPSGPTKPSFYYQRSWKYGTSNVAHKGSAELLPGDGSTPIKCPKGITRKTRATLLGCVEFNGVHYSCDVDSLELASWIPALGEKRNCSKANVVCEWSESWKNDRHPLYTYNRSTNTSARGYYLNSERYTCDRLPDQTNRVANKPPKAPRKKVKRTKSPVEPHEPTVQAEPESDVAPERRFPRATGAQIRGLSECPSRPDSRCYECIVTKEFSTGGSFEATAPCNENPGAPKWIYDPSNYKPLY